MTTSSPYAPPPRREPRLRAGGHVGRRQRPTPAPLEVGSCAFVELLVRQRDELRRFGDLASRCRACTARRPRPRGARSDSCLHVHEERARERRVGPVLRGLDARRDAAVAAVDLDRLQRVLVLLEVGEAEVAEAALLAGDAGDDRVVVLARRVVGAARALLAVDLVGEVVERARVGSGPEQRQLLVREGRVDVLPVLDLRAGPPDLASAARPSGMSAQSFSVLTTTVSASFATWNSTYSTPFVLADRRPPRP